MLLRQFVCVCVCKTMCFIIIIINLKQCVKKKKNQPKKTIHKTMNFGSTNWPNQKRSLGTQ